jgi:hypothetical protein
MEAHAFMLEPRSRFPSGCFFGCPHEVVRVVRDFASIPPTLVRAPQRDAAREAPLLRAGHAEILAGSEREPLAMIRALGLRVGRPPAAAGA